MTLLTTSMHPYPMDIPNDDPSKGFIKTTVHEWLHAKVSAFKKKEGGKEKGLIETVNAKTGSHMKVNNLSQWKDGSTRIPLDKIKALCESLEMDEEEVLYWTDKIYETYEPTVKFTSFKSADHQQKNRIAKKADELLSKLSEKAEAVTKEKEHPDTGSWS